MALDYLAAVALAAIQGITAWIPVSSKTMVILAGNAFFALSFQTALAYALLLHVGDLLAALWRYRNEYAASIRLALTPTKILSNSGASDPLLEPKFLIVSLVATGVTAAPLYLLSRKWFSSISGEPLLAIIGLLLIAMAIITLLSRRHSHHATIPSSKTAAITGACQGLAVLPGISRSGITQCALLLQGIEPQNAVRLSFLMAAPMILAAFAAFYFVDGFAGFSMEVILLGIAISALASHFTMGLITSIARRIPAHWFLAAVGLLAMLPMAIAVLSGIGS